MKKNKKVLNNIIWTLFSQIIIIILGIILPKLFIVNFGSETNGLISSVTQIFTYVSLIEAGIGSATINELYKFIPNNDEENISLIMSSSKKYYHKMIIFYIILVVLICFIYPFFIDSSIDYWIIFVVIAIQGITGLMEFAIVAIYKNLFIADGKNYVISNVTLIQKILTYVAKIILIFLGCNIIFVQLSFFVVTLLVTLIYYSIYKNHYFWVNLNVKRASPKFLLERKAFLIHEISTTIFSSTDIFIISIFCGLVSSSIYYVYSLIYASLNSLIGQVNKGLEFLLGYKYNSDKEKYTKLHDLYETIYMSIVFALFTIACVLTLPFIKLYTNNFDDANYVDEYLPILFTIINLLSCSRAVSARLITISGHAEKTINRTIIEATINLSTSIILVNFIGIYGVLLGTIIALLYRTNDIIIYANKKILNRKCFSTYKKLILFLTLFFIIYFIFNNVNIKCNDYFNFVLVGVVTSVIIVTFYFVFALIIDKELLIFIKSRKKA